MGQQYCCGHKVKIPDLNNNLNLNNQQLIEEIEDLRQQYKQDLEQSQVVLVGQAIFRGKINAKKQKYGYGQYYFKNYVYFGLFENDQPNGQGLAVQNDSSYYKGSFKDTLFDGFGKEYAQSYSFEGEFQKGHRKTGVFKNEQFQYHGSFNRNVFHGEGVIVFANGVRYEGSFRNGKIQGKGALVFPNGKVFKGQMAGGRCKEGKFSWSKNIVKRNPNNCRETEQHSEIEEFYDSPTFLLLSMLRNANRNKELQSTGHARTSNHPQILNDEH